MTPVPNPWRWQVGACGPSQRGQGIQREEMKRRARKVMTDRPSWNFQAKNIHIASSRWMANGLCDVRRDKIAEWNHSGKGRVTRKRVTSKLCMAGLRDSIQNLLLRL